jgi:hypothetical protein
MLGFLRFDEDYVDPVNCNKPGRQTVSAIIRLLAQLECWQALANGPNCEPGFETIRAAIVVLVRD